MANPFGSKPSHWGKYFDVTNRPLLILAATAMVCSRAMFALFQDPEGPNLVVVTGMATIIFLTSSAVYLSGFLPWLAGYKRVWAGIFLQLFIATGFYVCLR